MPGIESYGRRKPTSDSDEVRRFYSELVVFTDEEHAAIEQNLDRYRSLMQAEASDGGRWIVRDRLKDAMAAQGLYYYAEDLLTFFWLRRGFDEEAANMLHKAMIAKMKCLKMFPLPILMYEIGVLLAALGGPETSTMFTSFLDAQSQFAPEEFDKLLLDTIKSDITAATADARKRLCSPMRGVGADPSELQPKEEGQFQKAQALKDELKRVELPQSVRDWLHNHSVSVPTPEKGTGFPLQEESARRSTPTSTPEIVQKDLPEEKMEAFLKLAGMLIGKGINTPQEVARHIPENGRPYAQALWDTLRIVNRKLPAVDHDWNAIFCRAPGRLSVAKGQGTSGGETTGGSEE